MPLTSRSLGYDPASGLEQVMHVDEDTGDITLEDRQNVSALVEVNKAFANEDPGNWRADMHRVASIPMSIFYDLKRRGILDDDKALRKWLNDPDNRVFRTKPGRL